MRSGSRKPSKPVTNVIGRRRQDVSDDVALQEDSSCVSWEAPTSPLLMTPAQRKILSPAQRQTKNPQTKKEREVARHAGAERSSRASRGAALGVSEQQRMQLHTLQADRLHQLGQSMPLQERLHCLQKGHCLSVYQQALRNTERGRYVPGRTQSRRMQGGSQEFSKNSMLNPTTDADGGAAPLTSESAYVSDSGVRPSLLMQDFQERFNFFLHQHTTDVECPPDVIAPLCECGIPSALRQHNNEFEDCSCLWVCAGGKCMSSEQAGHFQDGEFVEISEVVCSNSARDISSSEDYEDLDLNQRLDRLGSMQQNGDTDSWWDFICSISIVLDPGAERALIQEMEVPECDCGKPVQTIVEKVTGELFGICRDRACFFICSYEKDLPPIGQLDVGQYMSIGQSVLDRYTTSQYAMRWFGHTFSKPFWIWLSHRAVDADYPKGSFQLEPGEEYTGFISYRGGSGRWVIQSTLCAEFNLAPAVYFLCIFCTCVGIGLRQIPDVCESSNASSWNWLVFADACKQPNSDRSWFIFRSYARVIVFFIIFFWHPVFSWFYRRQKWFVDKLCIHQSDPSGRTVPGVTRIPLFLRHSKRLYVLIDPEYTTRLWCVFELAAYLRLRENPRIVFVSIERKMLELFYVFLAAFFGLFTDSVQALAGTTNYEVVEEIVIQSDYGISAGLSVNDIGAKVSTWFQWACLVFVNIVRYIIAYRYFSNIRTLRETLASFDVARAKLHDENDRDLLLGIIDDLFRDEDAPLDADASAEQQGKRGSAENQIGHRLREHITGQQFPGPVKQEADDPEADDQEAWDSLEETQKRQEKGTIDDGLAAFNRSIKVNVRDQLPTTGIRSWCIVGYKTSVLVGALVSVQYRSLCDFHDFWAWQKTVDSGVSLESQESTDRQVPLQNGWSVFC